MGPDRDSRCDVRQSTALSGTAEFVGGRDCVEYPGRPIEAPGDGRVARKERRCEPQAEVDLQLDGAGHSTGSAAGPDGRMGAQAHIGFGRVVDSSRAAGKGRRADVESLYGGAAQPAPGKAEAATFGAG